MIVLALAATLRQSVSPAIHVAHDPVNLAFQEIGAFIDSHFAKDANGHALVGEGMGVGSLLQRAKTSARFADLLLEMILRVSSRPAISAKRERTR